MCTACAIDFAWRHSPITIRSILTPLITITQRRVRCTDLLMHCLSDCIRPVLTVVIHVSQVCASPVTIQPTNAKSLQEISGLHLLSTLLQNMGKCHPLTCSMASTCQSARMYTSTAWLASFRHHIVRRHLSVAPKRPCHGQLDHLCN